MTEKEWTALLKTYSTRQTCLAEIIEGIDDHVGEECRKGHTQTVATRSAGSRGLPPFHEQATVCDRGTHGCNLEHNDRQALRFAQMGLHRLRDLEEIYG